MPESLANITAEPITVDRIAFHSDAVNPRPAANGHGHDNGNNNGHRNYSGLDLSSFRPEQEAQFFLRLLLDGAITYKAACSSIPMLGQIELIYALREQTLSLFKTMASERGFNGCGDVRLEAHRLALESQSNRLGQRNGISGIGVDDSIPIPMRGSRSAPPSSSRLPGGKRDTALPLASVSIAP